MARSRVSLLELVAKTRILQLALKPGLSMTKSVGTLPKLPRALVDDSEEVSWALDIARGLAKTKEFEGALVWLRRAAQSAAIADADDRAVELAEAAKLLGAWVRSAEPEPSPKKRGKAEPALKRRSSTRTRRIAGQRAALSAPPAPEAPAAVSKPALKQPSTTTTQLMQISKSPKPTPLAKSTPKAKTVPPAGAAKPVKVKSLVPPPLAAPKAAKSRTSAPPAAAKKSVRPPPLKSVRPPPLKSVPPPAAKKSLTPPAPASVPPARKSMRAPQRTLLFSDMLPTANDPDDALVADSIRAIPAFAKLSKGKKLALSHSAEIVRLCSGEEIGVTGLVFVAQGEVHVSAAVSDCAPVTLLRGQVLRGQSSLCVPLALRCIANGEDAVLLRWTVGELAEALVDSRAVDDELRELADPVQAACGASLGTLAESVGEEVLRVLLQKMQLKRLAPGEVWIEQGKTMPGVCVLGLGALHAGSVHDYGPGDVPFAESALACEPLELALRAGSKGALLWVGTRAALFELLTSAPTLLESLTST